MGMYSAGVYDMFDDSNTMYAERDDIRDITEPAARRKPWRMSKTARGSTLDARQRPPCVKEFPSTFQPPSALNH